MPAWKTVLSDDDIVNLVELRFLSEHYHLPPERIIELRSRGRNFVAIHADARGGAPARAAAYEDRRENDQGRDEKDRGKGRGKGHPDGAGDDGEDGVAPQGAPQQTVG